MTAADDGSPEEKARSFSPQNASTQKSKRNSAYISEFARQVRLRAKRARRHVKPNVYLRKAVASGAKVQASKGSDAPELCKSAEEIRAEAPTVKPAVDKNEDMYQEVVDDDGVHLEQKRFHVSQEAGVELATPAHVVASEERGGENCVEEGELDASQDVDCYVASGEETANSPLEPLKPPGSELAVNSSSPDDRSSAGRECSTAVLHDSFTMAAPNESFSKGVATKGCFDCHVPEGLTSNVRRRMHRDQEITYSRRDHRDHSPLVRGSSRARSLSVSIQDGGAMSDTSKLEPKEHTVLETLLPDEPPGFSLDGGSDGASDHASGRRTGRIRKPVLERMVNSARNQAEGSESEEREPIEGSEYSGSDSAHGQEGRRRGVRNKHSVKRFSPSTPVRCGQFTDQVPSVLCDAEGNVWHIGKRAEQARVVEDVQLPGPPKARFKERHSVQQSHELPELSVKQLPSANYLPYSHVIPLKWRWSERADINNESTNRMVVAKERSVFVGCIPDGIRNLEELLHGLMDRFLERFDFAPVTFGQIEVVKSVKDFAFIELTSDKVAQIVLAANQLDVYEWGVNGYHFNIQGCTSTCTSVRPSIEYLPLRPARVLFVGNIPKRVWHQDTLDAVFTKLLRGSDRPSVSKYVISVLLIPDSSDAYVELASEIMADALIFKCTKNPEFLKEIGEEVFICRDASSIPLMSRHRGTIYPQRCLIIAVPPDGEALKINNVVKVFLDVLPYIAKKSNQAGYLEFVLIEPGKDYAFFQFNSEPFVDAIMDEYIESTQIFLCRGSPASYIILRPPEYVRPGARYRSGIRYKPSASHAYGSETVRQRQARRTSQNSSVMYAPRKFGDEPVKRPDFVLSIGASQPPVATWNGLTSSGCCASDPDCMIVVKGLPRGLSFKLARGALNELFERLLCDSGLLEAGRLLVTYLDRDGNLDVASLPNAELVCAILSFDGTFVVAGEEIRFLPYERKGFHCRSNSADLSGGPCELSSLSDEDSPGRMLVRNRNMEGMVVSCFQQPRSRGHSDLDGECFSKYDTTLRGPPGKQRTSFSDCADDWDHGWNGSFPSKQRYRGFSQENLQTWHGTNEQHQTWDTPSRSGSQGMTQAENLRCQGNNPKLRICHVQKGTGSFRNEMGNDDTWPRFIDNRSTEDGFRILSREGRRTIQQGGGPYVHESGTVVGMGGPSIRKRKLPVVGSGGSIGFSQKMRRTAQFP